MSLAQPSFRTDLADETAIVVGVDQALGRHLAGLLAACGAAVVLIAPRLADALAQQAEIKRSGGRALAVGLDVTQFEDIEPAFTEVEHQFGPATILINALALGEDMASIDLATEKFDALIQTNLRGPYILCAEFARRRIAARQSGRIVNLLPISAFHTDGRNGSAGSMAAAGLVRLTEVLAVEWTKFGINVNAIAAAGCEGDRQAEDPSVTAFPGHSPETFVQLDSSLLYLVSPSSDLVTGTCIKVDGARTGR